MYKFWIEASLLYMYDESELWDSWLYQPRSLNGGSKYANKLQFFNKLSTPSHVKKQPRLKCPLSKVWNSRL